MRRGDEEMKRRGEEAVKTVETLTVFLIPLCPGSQREKSHMSLHLGAAEGGARVSQSAGETITRASR